MTIRRNFKTETNPEKRGYQEFFIQDEITFTEKQKLLLGMRYDYNSIHGNHNIKNCLQMEIERQ
jgi:outer membrane receptor for ferrienterochelin and colicin